MDNTKKMLTAIINGQSSMKQELLKKIDNVDKKLEVGMNDLEEKMDKGFSQVNVRIDMLGKQLNTLDGDAPTSEEFNKLKQKVDKYIAS